MKRLKVLVVHNRYQLAGGEDAVVDEEVRLLRSRGHEVETYLRDNHELKDISALDAFSQALWSRRTWREITQLVDGFRPDVIHAHNTFALVSASIYWAAKRAAVPVVQTLHNFRLLCVQAMFLREGRVCEDCLGRVPWPGVVRKCYRNSGLQSAALATMVGMHRTIGTYREKVARYIALTEFCRAKFIEGGLPAARIVVKPNFVDVAHPPETSRSGGLFVGRLAPEKGLDTLIDSLRELPNVAIDVIGDGPERSKAEPHSQLKVTGWLAPAAVQERMQHAGYLVMPSIWYENFPRTLVEAYANGLPVIASRLGAMAELVEHGRTGLLFEPGDPSDLARHLAWAEAFPKKMRAMGERAREVYEQRFTPERNYEQLMAIYHDAIAGECVKAAG